MNSDLDVIVKQFPAEWPLLRLYAIGDVHAGSAQFSDAIKKKLQIIKDDPYGVLSICGDLGDYGLKNSKTNVYQATMQPKEQQEFIFKLFEPVKDKIVSAVPGNHEERVTRETGLCPLYDLCVLWGIPEVYRENVAILKLLFGLQSNGKRQHSFVGITTHGSSIRKHQRFSACFQPIDFSIAGHSHTPMYYPHGVIRIDAKHAKASWVAYHEIIVDANLTPGGYSIKHEYEIAPPPELQYLEMRVIRENNRERTAHKIIDYHAIQI